MLSLKPNERFFGVCLMPLKFLVFKLVSTPQLIDLTNMKFGEGKSKVFSVISHVVVIR